MNESIPETAAALRAFYESGRTLDYEYRKAALKRLLKAVQSHEKDVMDALKKDLNKSVYESSMTEYNLVIDEIRYALRHLKKWMRPRRVLPSLGQLPGGARVLKRPFGTALVMSPWNYPFLLTMSPLAGAVAAGNTVMLKPSDYAPNTAKAVKIITEEAFEKGHVACVLGGRKENTLLLDTPFDYIFFTGSPAVGRLVMEKAAKGPTPVTLELGGKSPVIVDETADLPLAARRILFGKLLNSGQTCVAPDYVIAVGKAYDGLKEALLKEYKRMVPTEDYHESHVGRIVNQKHFDRLSGALQEARALAPVWGGEENPETLHIRFALAENPPENCALMREEIFGPVLPLLRAASADEAIAYIARRPRPLALYLFTKDGETEQKVFSRLSFGGGCVNDTVLHLASVRLPFGGVGASGMGSYHGKKTFDTFTHEASVYRRSPLFDVFLRYHPYKRPDSPLFGGRNIK